MRYARHPYDDAYAGYYDPAADWEEPARPGRLVTPGRFLLVLLLLISGGVATYGIFLDRTATQIPLAVSGLAVSGVLLTVLAFVGARSAARLGRSGFGGRALVAALLGGFCALGAAGSLAGALVLGLVMASV